MEVSAIPPWPPVIVVSAVVEVAPLVVVPVPAVPPVSLRGALHAPRSAAATTAAVQCLIVIVSRS
jgi:hypothetical protein